MTKPRWSYQKDHNHQENRKDHEDHVDHVTQADRSIQGKKERVNNVNVMVFIGNFAVICGDYWKGGKGDFGVV